MSPVIWQVSGSIEIFSYLVLSGSDIHQQLDAIVYQINFEQITNQAIISYFKGFHWINYISHVSKSPYQLSYHSLCGISHNGLPSVTACMSMQGIQCVFATHLVDRKNDNSWLTSILWIYTVVDSYNPSHIAGISLATHESCIRTNKYWNSWGIPRRRWRYRMEKETSFKVFEKIKFGYKFLPSFFYAVNKTFDNCGLKI